MPPQPRPGILEIAPYVGGEARIPGIERPIRLASNENPFGASPAAIAAYHAAAAELNRYPDGTAAALRQAQLGLMERPETSHPYYWAGFAVVGDGAVPVIRNAGSAGGSH